jgi:HEAT repeat protein
MTDLEDLLADLTSGDEALAEGAALRFTSLGSRGFYVLAALSASTDPDERWWALRALSEFQEARVSKLLRLGLEDADPGVRACAALGLRKHPDEKAIPKLLGLLRGEDQLLARLGRDALTALGKAATPHLTALIEAEDAPHTARLEAVRALAGIEDPAAIGTLFKVYQDGSGLMQHWAEEGLTRLGIGMMFFNPE